MSTNISTWIANVFRRSTHSFLMAGVELAPMDTQSPLIHFLYLAMMKSLWNRGPWIFVYLYTRYTRRGIFSHR